MSKAHCVAFLVALISVIIILISLEANAQSTVDDHDGASCESSTLDEAVNHMRKDLTDVKNLLKDRQTTCSSFNSSGLCKWNKHVFVLCIGVFVYFAVRMFVCLNFCTSAPCIKSGS